MKKLAVGIMSGTSLDGVDVSLCNIEGTKDNTIVQELFSKTFSYPKQVLNNIRKVIDDKASISLICSLNVELAYMYADFVLRVLDECGKNTKDLSFVACHGQTVFHITSKEKELHPSSLQLGDGSVLAQLLKTTVVSNFRNADIAAGGQGAPLVPYFDYILYKDKRRNVCFQNIGGIANGTIFKNNSTIDDVIAFDNGPGNMMIDYSMKVLFGKTYDSNGEIASSGEVVAELFYEVIENEYFKELPPKSTGRELFGDNYTQQLLNKYHMCSSEDIIATFTHITAYSIAQSYKEFLNFSLDEIIVSGGGSHNRTLLNLINFYYGKNVVKTLDSYGVSNDFKEAIAFVVLGNETLSRNPSNVKSATGATKNVILGQVSYGKEE